MAFRTQILFSILLATLVFCNVLVHNVEARKGGFFTSPPLNSPPGPETGGYMDPKEYYPTGRENSYNSYYGSGEGQGNGYGNGAGEGGGYKEGVNGYGRGAEYTTQNAGGAGYGGQGFGNGGGYGSGEWRGSNGGGGYGEGVQYGSGEWRGSNSGGGYRQGAEYGGYNTEFGNGNRYGRGYGAGFGNGNREYVPRNGFNQENP